MTISQTLLWTLAKTDFLTESYFVKSRVFERDFFWTELWLIVSINAGECVENWTRVCFLGIFHPPRTELRIFVSERCLSCWCMSLNLSLKYSLEEGLQLSFSIVSVSIHVLYSWWKQKSSRMFYIHKTTIQLSKAFVLKVKFQMLHFPGMDVLTHLSKFWTSKTLVVKEIEIIRQS